MPARPSYPSARPLALCFLACACGGTDPAGPPQLETTNVLFVTLDTTRADRLGAYGHAGASTPHLDALAAGGACFERAYAHVPLTLPTHASLFTGTFPPEHGIHDNGRRALGADLVTLAEVFAERGYRTAAFVSAIALDGSFGLDRGFERYDDDLGEPAPGLVRVLDRPGSEVVDGALSWLAEGQGPFFLWAHFYDPHAEYRPPSDFAMADPYDGELSYVDAQLGRLFGWLEAERLREETLVVVVADHGESLGEKGEHTHGALIYEGTQRIPLFIVQPGRIEPGLRVKDLVQQADVFPSLMELFDWPLPAQVSGTSFAPALRGEDLGRRTAYLESEYSALNFGWSPLHGLVRGRWKYVQAPTPELYDLAADPGETRDLAAERPEILAELERELRELMASMNSYAANAPDLRPGMAADLSALGYAQGSASTDAQGSDVNPIERIETLELYHAAIGFANRGEWELMVEPLEQVVADCPDGAGFRTLLGDAYRRLRRFDEARAQLEAALELDPRYDPAHYYLGALHEARGNVQPALDAYRRNLALRPEYVPAREAVARLLARRQDHAGALAEYEQIVELDPNQARHWLVRADLEGRLDHPLRRVEALTRATELAPGDLLIENDLAWVLSTSPVDAVRDGERALRIARRIVEASQRAHPDLLDTLAAALAENGDFEEARSVAREALTKARSPDFLEFVGRIETHLVCLERDEAIREP
jgi:arylsulfatase A-like enzyme